MTDTDRINWLAAQGNGIALIHDDTKRWAVVGDGMQPVTHIYEDGREAIITQEPIPGIWSYVVDAADWHDDIRTAIDTAFAKEVAR